MTWIVLSLSRKLCLQPDAKTWKKGIIIPIHKGGHKRKNDPNNYRPVSLLPTLYKLMERLICKRILCWLKLAYIEFPSKQQQGFQKGLSCITTSFSLQECIHENLEQKSKVYVAFLDTYKAFDTVQHNAIFNKLYNIGITGNLFRILLNAYTDMYSAVIHGNTQSRWFRVQRSVRKGGIISTFLYLLHINDMLIELETTNAGAKVQSIEC